MNWYRNLKITSKLLIGFLLMAFLTVAVGAVGIINIRHISKDDQELYEINALSLQYSGSASVNFQQLRYNILNIVNAAEKSDIENISKLIEQYKKSTDEYIIKFLQIDSGASSAEIGELTAAITEGWSKYQKELVTFMELRASDNTAGMKAKVADLASIGSGMRDNFLKLMALVAAEAEMSAAHNTRTASTSSLLMIIIVCAAAIISITLCLFISNMIGSPLVLLAKLANLLSLGDINTDAVLNEKDMQLKYRKDEIGKLYLAFNELISGTKAHVRAAQLVAAGDLTAEIRPRSENDVLGKALANLIDNLSAIVTSIINASEQVSAGSNSLSDSSMALSQGATEQASSVEELTASIEEIASQTSLNSKNADMANEYAIKAKTNADSGNTQMKEMLKAMDEINISSASINKIIKVIDDIAFQTNILALNAAVEAARAGQQGLGFAVVAEEVRTLAAKSASAASETTEMIETSIRKVEAGTKIANETAMALNRIVADVEKAADLVSSIASASKEQAAAIEQINRGVMQISQVVQTNAATSEESAAASEELSGQAAQLKEIVNSFKINSGISAADNTSSVSYKDRTAGKQPVIKPVLKAPASKPKIILSDGNFGKY